MDASRDDNEKTIKDQAEQIRAQATRIHELETELRALRGALRPGAGAGARGRDQTQPGDAPSSGMPTPESAKVTPSSSSKTTSAKVAPAGGAETQAPCRRRRSSIVDTVAGALRGDDGDARGPLGASAQQIIEERPALRRVSMACKPVTALTPADTRPMADALLKTIQNYPGPLTEAIDAWAVAVGFKTIVGDGRGKGSGESLPLPVVLALVRAIVDDIARLKKLARWGLAGRLLGGLAITYVDVITDVLARQDSAEHFPVMFAPRFALYALHSCRLDPHCRVVLCNSTTGRIPVPQHSRVRKLGRLDVWLPRTFAGVPNPHDPRDTAGRRAVA